MTDATSSKKRKLEDDAKAPALPEHIFVVEQFSEGDPLPSRYFYREQDAKADMARLGRKKDALESVWERFFKDLEDGVAAEWPGPAEVRANINFSWPVASKRLTRDILGKLSKEIKDDDYQIDLYAHESQIVASCLTLELLADWCEGKPIPPKMLTQAGRRAIKEGEELKVWLSASLFACPSAVEMFTRLKSDNDDNTDAARVIHYTAVAMKTIDVDHHDAPTSAALKAWDESCRAVVPTIFPVLKWGYHGAVRLVKRPIR